MARFPTAKLRAEKICGGIIGLGALRSHHGNATRQATPTIRLMSTAGWDKPSRCCSMSAYTAPVRPTAVSTAPTTSTLACRSDPNSSSASLVVKYSVTIKRHHVDPEDPAPVQRVDEDSAEQRADDESRSGPSGPGADRSGLPGTR